MWRWVRPGGGVLWYDFTFDNPRNPDVRGVPLARVRELFPHGASQAPTRHAGAAARARACRASASIAVPAVQCAAAAAHACAGLDRKAAAMSHADFLPFALPEIGEEEIAEVVDTLRSGWITTGPKAKRFEEDFTAFLGDPALH